MWDCYLNIKWGSLPTAALERGLGRHPGLDLGRNRERTEESNRALEVEIRNQDPRMSPRMCPSKAADTVYSVRAKFKSIQELAPQIG